MKVYVVIEGGCCRYVASDTPAIKCEVIDLDDLHDADEEDRHVMEPSLAEAETWGRIW